jgi:hypothetical protein
MLKPPLVAWHISTKEKGGRLDKVLSLEGPSLIVTTHLEMEVAYTFYNAIDTLCL